MFGIKKLKRKLETAETTLSINDDRLYNLVRKVETLERALTDNAQTSRLNEVLSEEGYPPTSTPMLLTSLDILTRFDEVYAAIGKTRVLKPEVPAHGVLVPDKARIKV